MTATCDGWHVGCKQHAHLCVPDQTAQVDRDVDASIAVREHLHAHDVEVVPQLLVLAIKQVPVVEAATKQISGAAQLQTTTHETF